MLTGGARRLLSRVALAVVAVMALQVGPVLFLWPLPEEWAEALAPLVALYWVATFPLALLLSYSFVYRLLLVAVTALLLGQMVVRRRQVRWLVALGAWIGILNPFLICLTGLPITSLGIGVPRGGA